MTNSSQITFIIHQTACSLHNRAKMALKMHRHAAFSSAAFSHRRLVVRATQSSSSSSSGDRSGSSNSVLAQRLASAALAASLLLSPVGAAEAVKAQQLSDLLASDYAFLDANRDGVISRCVCAYRVEG